MKNLIVIFGRSMVAKSLAVGTLAVGMLISAMDYCDAGRGGGRGGGGGGGRGGGGGHFGGGGGFSGGAHINNGFHHRPSGGGDHRPVEVSAVVPMSTTPFLGPAAITGRAAAAITIGPAMAVTITDPVEVRAVMATTITSGGITQATA